MQAQSCDPIEKLPGRLALPGLLLGGVLIGCSPIFVRLSEVGSVSTAFWRLALALLPLLLIAGRSKAETSSLPRGLRGTLVVTLPGVFLGAELVAWHVSLHMTSVANSTLLVNMAPISVVLFGWILSRRSASRLFLLALAVTVSGVVVLKGGPQMLGDGDLAGDAIATSGGDHQPG